MQNNFYYIYTIVFTKNLEIMAGIFSLGGLIGMAAKAAKSASKERERQRKQEVRMQLKLEKERQKRREKIEEQQRIADYESRGYVLMSVRSLEKYISGAIIPESLFDEMQTATMRNVSKIPVHKSVLDDMNKRIAEHKAKERKLQQCAALNNKGIEFEKENMISHAIKCYEKNIISDYQATHSYKRLMVLYRKEKDYSNELRVIERAVEVFPASNQFCDEVLARKEKVIELMQK